MRNSIKTFGKLTIPILLLFAISFSALPVQAKYGGGTGEPNDPYLIFDANHMNAIGADSNDWDKHFKLMADIDLSGFTGTEFNIIGTGHFECSPIMICWFVGTPFTGVFDGNGHTISNFTYQYNGDEFVGLFGCVDGESAQIKNLGLRDVDINNTEYGLPIGSLVGLLFNGTVIDCYTQGGSVSGEYRVGGLVGQSDDPASIYNCHADVNVSGHGDIGGLVGTNSGTISNCYSNASAIGVYYVGGLAGFNLGTITDSYSSGSVAGYKDVGGLVGENRGTITNCHSKGNFEGEELVGGLVGVNSHGTITNCYATSRTSGGKYVGGLVGINTGIITNCYSADSVLGETLVGGLLGSNSGEISNCYSIGNVSGTTNVGGLVGRNGSERFSGTITNCYSAAAVTGTTSIGGLVGINVNGTVTFSFWDVNASGLDYSDGGVGKTTVEMQTKSTFTDAGWDFVGETVNGPNDIWKICEGQDYPRFSWEKYGGGTGESENPYLIYTSCQMNEIGADANDWDKHFLLCADIDLSGYTGTEFNMIGAGRLECTLDLCWIDGTPFTGVFDGNGHTISNFTYEYIGDEFVGLFGYVDGESAQIKNLFLRDVDIDVQHNGGDPDYGATGSLIGELSNGTVIGCYIQGGNLSGGSRVGGMVGVNSGTIANCHSSGNFEGEEVVGGLVGNSQGTITNCYSTGSVSGSSYVGGLVGSNFDTISNCYSNGNVSGTTNVGGLVGMNGLCIPEWRCYPGTISNCYSTGSVSGDGDVGGLVGISYIGNISNCYAIGVVSGLIDIGGLLGIDYENESILTSCYFLDPNDGGGPDNGYGEPLTDAKMMQQASFIGWDFVGETVNGPNDIWDICEGTNYPKFLWQIPPGDFVCPDGVNFFDYSFFASQWAEENCAVSNDCDGRDLDLLGSVDIRDLRIFADNWLAGL